MSSHVKLSRVRLRPLGARCIPQLTRHQRRSRHDFNHFVRADEAYDAATDAPLTNRDAATTFKLAVKDNIATHGLPTTCSSAILSSHKSPYEATIVRQLRDRGAHVVGKTNMDEFGMGSHSLNSVHGPVLNPLSATPTSAGGSSGGSAVAVQTGEADVALGTDTGGSIRLPAAYCGVVGYKPSYGMLSRFGVVPYANSLDTVGLLAREVGVIEDLMFSTGLDGEHDAQDPTSLSESFRKRQQAQGGTDRRSRLRIGIPIEYNIEELDPQIRTAWSDAADLLQQSGIDVVPVSLPSTKHALSAYYVIAPAEASSNLAKFDGVRYGTRGDESDGAGEVLYSKTRGLGFGDEVRRRILLGSYSLSSEAMDNYFLQAQRVRRLVQRDFDRVFRRPNPLYDERQFDLSDMGDGVELQDKLGPSQVDFLLCPTAPTFAPRIDEVRRQTPVQVYMNDVFTVPASLAGLPAVSIPKKVESHDAEADESRKVAGLQLIGQYWDDRRLLGVAKDLLRRFSA
ncbi:glutamyl-tRNA(Gln) amidotransferase subunit A, mitochondrial [Colletotrichum higginsianum]|nr:glutamyl-tRNA(Gln) amidotransferase subunit A, mitochondrial [Colletotrichum higginsianum]